MFCYRSLSPYPHFLSAIFLQILPQSDFHPVIVVRRALASIKSGKKRGQKLVGFFANFRPKSNLFDFNHKDVVVFSAKFFIFPQATSLLLTLRAVSGE